MSDDDEPSIWHGSRALILIVAVVGTVLMLVLVLADRAGAPL